MPRVAVIIPTYNDSATLAATVSSLESEEEHELIIVDDGSDEPKALAALELLARRYHVVRQPNCGLAAARMRGVAATSAPYVFPLDADDLIVPGALADLADVLDAAPDAAIAWGDLIVEAPERQPLYRHSVPLLCPWFSLYVNGIPSSSLIRRQSLLAAGGWREGIGFPDKDLWLSLAELGLSGRYLKRPVYRYCVRESGMFNSSRQRYGERNQATLSRHSQLLRDERVNRKRSSAPLALKSLIPFIWSLPLSEYRRSRLARAAAHLLWFGSWREALHYLGRAL